MRSLKALSIASEQAECGVAAAAAVCNCSCVVWLPEVRHSPQLCAWHGHACDSEIHVVLWYADRGAVWVHPRRCSRALRLNPRLRLQHATAAHRLPRQTPAQSHVASMNASPLPHSRAIGVAVGKVPIRHIIGVSKGHRSLQTGGRQVSLDRKDGNRSLRHESQSGSNLTPASTQGPIGQRFGFGRHTV